ncbi:hypothetical protein ACE15N_08755 [Xanthomonas campestris pv. passiflorae]|uniref:hypothetical protein n=1 Tax=Xanthomonas campestris TaxID=339 RepID=UPI00242590C9|nr:hypothetical protein [Xanthomonas campestris]MBV6814530.1 hypothetical protein [Xanthomonas campestris pv. passiflorae]
MSDKALYRWQLDAPGCHRLRSQIAAVQGVMLFGLDGRVDWRMEVLHFRAQD